MNRRNLILLTLLILSASVGITEFYLNSIGEFLAERTQTIWGIICLLLTILWAVEDSKTQEFYKPFEFGFLMYIFWPIAFPYYLLSTRKFDGLIYIAGFLAIWSGPWFLGLVGYVYVYS
jgi:TM2 domain-containing membrane protein YozV